MSVRIAIWSGPRNISTALMRAFENRGDTFVSDEPFYAHYLAETGVNHPMRDEVIQAYNTNWDEVTEMLTGSIPGGFGVWYQKHMAQHNLPGADLSWTKNVTNCFLIRDPQEVILSYSKKYEIKSNYQLGYPQQADLFEKMKKENGDLPIVMDARDVLLNPKKLLKKFCNKIGIPFSERMLSWSAGRRVSDGIWGRHWYGNVEKSTGFQPYIEKEENLPNEYRGIYKDCMEHYQQLYQGRLK